MMGYKVKAFTIIEITISMLIAAIVIGIGYTAFLIISGSYRSFRQKSEDLESLIQLDRLLKKDFAGADSIFKTANGLQFRRNRDSVQYDFQPDFIIRNSTITDTFKFQNQDVQPLFENQAVNSSDVEQDRIDELNLTIVFRDEKIPYHYYKEYSSENLIERMNHALH